jgi:hypothetical protein
VNRRDDGSSAGRRLNNIEWSPTGWIACFREQPPGLRAEEPVQFAAVCHRFAMPAEMATYRAGCDPGHGTRDGAGSAAAARQNPMARRPPSSTWAPVENTQPWGQHSGFESAAMKRFIACQRFEETSEAVLNRPPSNASMRTKATHTPERSAAGVQRRKAQQGYRRWYLMHRGFSASSKSLPLRREDAAWRWFYAPRDVRQTPASPAAKRGLRWCYSPRFDSSPALVAILPEHGRWRDKPPVRAFIIADWSEPPAAAVRPRWFRRI